MLTFFSSYKLCLTAVTKARGRSSIGMTSCFRWVSFHIFTGQKHHQSSCLRTEDIKLISIHCDMLRVAHLCSELISTKSDPQVHISSRRTHRISQRSEKLPFTQHISCARYCAKQVKLIIHLICVRKFCIQEADRAQRVS